MELRKFQNEDQINIQIKQQKMSIKEKRQEMPHSPPSYPSLQLSQIINSDPILSQYFNKNCQPHQYWTLAHELMLNGLRYKAINESDKANCHCQCHNIKTLSYSNQKQNIKPMNPINNKIQPIVNQPIQQQKRHQVMGIQNNKHYNVSYIKHNRFLSPKQRKQVVTPKITEIIPQKSHPLVIYGKPRVKVDNQCGCPYHNNQNQCLRQSQYVPSQPIETRPKVIQEIHIKEKQSLGQNKMKSQIPIQPNNQLMRYNSTPNLIKYKKQQMVQHDLQKTKKNKKKPNSKANLQVNTKQKNNEGIEQVKGQTIYVDRIIQIESRTPRGHLRILNSPKVRQFSRLNQEQDHDYQQYLLSRYQGGQKKKNKRDQEMIKQIQSKIKFLIDRDKKNKAIQKQMKKQDKKLKQLQLLVRKSGQHGKTLKLNKKMNDSPSDSDMTILDQSVVNNYRGQLTKNKAQNRSQLLNKAGSKNKKRITIDQIRDAQQSSAYNEDEIQQKIGSAYFGTKQHDYSQGVSQSYQQSCQCDDKTFSNLSSQQDDQQSQDFSAFKIKK